MQSQPRKSDLTANQLRDMVMRVTAACLSPDAELHLKGCVGRELIGEIIAFQYKILDPLTHVEVGEIDIETSTALIEVTNASEGALEKLCQLKYNPHLNPKRKKVVLYAPQYVPAAAREVVEEGIPIIQSLERLQEYIRRIS